MGMIERPFQSHYTPDRRGTIHFNPHFWRTASDRTKTALIRTIEDPPKDLKLMGRTCLVQALEPVEFPGNESVLAFRIKGALPTFGPDGNIIPHIGKGHVSRILEVEPDGTIRHIDADGIQSPEGGAFLEFAKKEFDVAAHVGSSTADHAIGYGVFDSNGEQSEELGFTIFGQNDLFDTRANLLLRMYMEVGLLGRKGLQPFCRKSPIQFAFEVGAVLARFHLFYVHRYFHLGNVGVCFSSEGETPIVRDFESCISIDSLTPEQRFTYRYLDFENIAILLWISGRENILDALKINGGTSSPEIRQTTLWNMHIAFIEGYLYDGLWKNDLQTCALIFQQLSDLTALLERNKKEDTKLNLFSFFQSATTDLGKFIFRLFTQTI